MVNKVSRDVVAFSLFLGDTVVLIVLLGITVGALAGRLAGGIRVAFFLLSLILALSFGHLLAGLGLFAKMTELFGFKNPLWLLLIPRLLATVLLMLAFIAVLESVHRKIYLYYKYKNKDDLSTDDFDTWEYLNDIWGLTLGMATGIACLMVLFSWLHVPGYLLLQTRPAELCERFDPWGHRLLRRICADMHELGLDASAARFGPAKPSYYAAADTIGYIYNNYGSTNLYESNRFHQRVFGYPGISPMLRQKEIHSLWTNSVFLKLWSDNTNFHLITAHSKVKPLLHAALSGDENGTAPPEYIKHLANMDLIDYHKFLRTGRSDVYKADNPNQAAVIGTWQLDIDETYEGFRRLYPQAHEPKTLAAHSFLANAARREFSGPNKMRTRQYDWLITFTADNKVSSQGRYFPTGRLFTQQQQVYHFSDPGIYPQRAQWASGSWSTPNSSSSVFLADLRVNTNPVSMVKVRITSANNHLIIRFPTKYFNEEEYVFRQYEF